MKYVKTTSFRKLALAALSVCLLPAFAGATIITTNGDFEAGSATGDNVNFENTPNWTNRGTEGDTAVARRNNLNLGDSTYNAVINDRYNDFDAGGPFVSAEFGSVVHSQNTGYAIQAEDFFEVRYDWRDAFDWQPRDIVRVVLFATDNNTLGGSIVWSSILDSDQRQVVGEWEPVFQTSSVVASEAVGQTLFVNFFGVDTGAEGAAGPTGFARVNNLEVTAIPEPRVYALLAGLSVLALALRRRFRSR